MKFPTLQSKALLSPMSGVTDAAFRALAKKYGAGLTYTEFVNSTSIVRGNQTAHKMLEKDESESPAAVQLFGHNEEDVVNAAKHVQKTFDVIDINCGCPAWKVIRTGAGSEMLKEPQKIMNLLSKLVNAVNKPVTVKIRTGIDDANINAVEVAKLAEQAGAAAIAIHGRTQKQGYTGKANWEIIREVKKAVKIPVIGNGDVFTPEQFKEKLEQSEVDYVMIARGAIGNPYIFKQINDYLTTGKYDTKNGLEQFFEYLELAQKHKIDYSTIKMQASSFTKGLDGAAKIREKIMQCKTLDELKCVIGSISHTNI